MIDLLAIDIEGQVGVGLDDVNGIIGAERVPIVMIQRADAPWGDTLDDLVDYAKEHPGEIRHISGGPGSGHDATMQSWVRRLGIEVKDIQSGTPAERALAVASGEGDINTSPVDVFSPHMDAGRVEPLMISGKDMPRAVGQAAERAGLARLDRRPVRPGARRRRRAGGHRTSTASGSTTSISRRRRIRTTRRSGCRSAGCRSSISTMPALRTIADTAIEKVKPIYIEKGIYWEQQKQ